MVHTKVYGYCDAKCKVEVAPKETVDQIDARIDSEIEARAEAIAEVQAEINARITSRQIIAISDGQALFNEIKNMNVGDELIFGKINVVTPVNGSDDGNIILSGGTFDKGYSNLFGNCSMTVGSASKVYGTGSQIVMLTDSFYVSFSTLNEGVWVNDGYKTFEPSRISKMEDCYIVKRGNAEIDNVNLNYETWTFTLDDGTTVTKEVCVR